MKKSSLDQQTKDQITERILKLQPDSRGNWGNLTVNEMLFHCKKVNDEILQSKEQSIASTFKQKVMKIVGLHLMKKFPKGIQTGSKYLPAAADNIEFKKGQSELVSSIHYIAGYNSPIHGLHPFFGPLKTDEWRRFMWMHLDHHLRQFNL